MRRREFIAYLPAGAAAVLCGIPDARAQRSIRRIGVLTGVPAGDPIGKQQLGSLQEGLKDHGLTAGRDVLIDHREGTADPEQATNNARELVGLKPDVIVVGTTPGITAVLRETVTIPVVFVNVADPIGSGFISELARPGGNITGFSNFEPSMAGKSIEVLREIAPSTRQILGIFNPETKSNAAYLQSLQAAAHSTALEAIAAPVRSSAEIETAISSFGKSPNGGLVIFPDVYMLANRQPVIDLAAKYRLPAVYGFRRFPSEGGLASYGLDPFDPYRRAASYVGRILSGEKAGELPVQQPTKFELVINLKTAKVLGLTVPQSLLLRADEVIE